MKPNLRYFAFLLISCLLGASSNAQTDPLWTPEIAAGWFAKMDWLPADGAVRNQVLPDTSINKVEFARQYHANPGRWNKAFVYLRTTDLLALPPGKYPIDGENVFAMITEGPPRLEDSAEWESHRNYEDIHYVISGSETIGLTPLSQAKPVRPYDGPRDLWNYKIDGTYYVATPERFFIATTEEAHRPGLETGGCRHIKKLVIKVRKSVPGK